MLSVPVDFATFELIYRERTRLDLALKVWRIVALFGFEQEGI